MHVTCECGNRLAVSVDRLPAKIRCDGCVRAFYVSEDGRLLEMDEVQPIPVRALCRCGQPFVFRAENFPHRVSCHVCGLHFVVLDTGEIVDHTNADRASHPGKSIPSTAIQLKSPSLVGDGGSTAIAGEENFQRLKEASADSAMEVHGIADLKLIDLTWKVERLGYSLIPFGGIQIMPSKQSALYIGLALLIAWLCAFGPALMTDHGGLLGLVLRFGVAPSLFLPFYIYVRAHAYEKAERDWQRKRIVAIAKWESDLAEN